MDTEDRIFAAAQTIFGNEGLEGLSIRAVAKSAGLSPMAIYRHFADKDALVDALMRDGFAEWERIGRTIRHKDPIQWLHMGFNAFLEFALKQPHRFDAAFLLPARTARRYPDDFAAGRSPAVAMFQARLDEARAQGRIDDTPTLDIVLTLSALAQGLVSMQRAGRFTDERAFRALYRRTVHRAIAAFTREPLKRKRRKA